MAPEGSATTEVSDMAANTTSPSAAAPAGDRAVGLLATALLATALAVGLPGNGFVVWSIARRMRRPSVTALLVLNLALADLAVLLTAPFFLHALARGAWRFRGAGCLACHYVCGVSMYASVLLVAAMSLDRSLAVARPFAAQALRTRKAARPVLAAVWLAALLLAAPALRYRGVAGPPGRPACAALYPDLRHRAFHLLFEALTGFALPFAAVLASYADVGRRLRARRLRRGRGRRAGRLVALIVGAFAAFWLPYHLVNLAEAGRALAGLGPGSGPAGARLARARGALIALAFLSSSVNPVLYACAGGGLLRSAGVGFVAKLLEGTGSERGGGGTLPASVRAAPAGAAPARPRLRRLRLREPARGVPAALLTRCCAPEGRGGAGLPPATPGLVMDRPGGSSRGDRAPSLKWVASAPRPRLTFVPSPCSWPTAFRPTTCQPGLTGDPAAPVTHASAGWRPPPQETGILEAGKSPGSGGSPP
ncbi:leukotriene B4 receptor 1-like [Perognathus longimembris pacificus]|uniref:leukotriene B4 receptor 1-like n=1 Tax=Perognathus longimembris pacificus TaxID=214514 RepID=UPI0020195386|nr:leukotriene B4 receptor 1-like [Perognathus longimembris pacificus]